MHFFYQKSYKITLIFKIGFLPPAPVLMTYNQRQNLKLRRVLIFTHFDIDIRKPE